MLTTDQIQSLRFTLARVCTRIQEGSRKADTLQLRAEIVWELRQAGESVEALRALTGVKNVSSVHDMLRAETKRRAAFPARELQSQGTPGAYGWNATPANVAAIDANVADMKAQRARRQQKAAARTPEQLRAEAIDPEGLEGAPTYESRERNERKASAGRHDQRCPLCSSPLKDNEVQATGAWVRMSTDGFLIPMRLTAEEETAWEASGYDMGCFIVGSGCARRVPAAYKERVAAR